MIFCKRLLDWQWMQLHSPPPEITSLALLCHPLISSLPTTSILASSFVFFILYYFPSVPWSRVAELRCERTDNSLPFGGGYFTIEIVKHYYLLHRLLTLPSLDTPPRMSDMACVEMYSSEGTSDSVKVVQDVPPISQRAYPCSQGFLTNINLLHTL